VFDFNLPEQRPEHALSMIALCEIGRDGVTDISIQPTAHDAYGSPIPLEPGSPEFAAYLQYLERTSQEAGLTTRYRSRGAQIVAEPG
jgi:hypothetical protein